VLAPNEVLSSVGDFISRQVAELIVINSVCVVGPTQQRYNFLLQSFGFRLHPILSTPSAVSRQERRASYVETQLPSTFFRSASRLQVSVASVPAPLRAPTMLSQLSAVLFHDDVVFLCLPKHPVTRGLVVDFRLGNVEPQFASDLSPLTATVF
jgi:hypothetical protein